SAPLTGHSARGGSARGGKRLAAAGRQWLAGERRQRDSLVAKPRELAMQRAAVDAEQRRRARLVAACRLEDAQDELALQPIQRPSFAHAAGDEVVRRALRRRARSRDGPWPEGAPARAGLPAG